jgi:ribonucleoside-triphosphate reductase
MESKTLNFFRKELELLNLPKDAVEDILKSIEEHYARVSLPLGQTSLPEIVKVFKEQPESSTDISLLVATPTKGTLIPWNRERITEALIKEARLSKEEAEDIAQAVEKKIFAADLKTVSTSLIRALVDNELLIRGFTKKLAKQRILGMPTFDVKQLIYSKTLENSNISANNPEAINLTIAETILKQYALQNIFSEEVADAHLKGAIHIHDLGYPTRTYCSGHSLDYIKKYGLELETLNSISKPATHARTLTGHLNTFLASMQAYYAGALGIGFFNIFYAPYLVGKTNKELKQEAQYIIFSGSQNAFSRGGQTLFLDYNINLGVPSYLENVPAIGPKGKYMLRHKNGEIEKLDEIPRDKQGNPIDPKGAHILRYKDFEKEAQRFARAMLEVWEEGDAIGQPFFFPKCDLHISEDVFKDPEQYKLFQYACQVASKNGAPYFIFDRGKEAILSQCCRLREKVTDPYMLNHPESLRFCGFQIVTINLPQAAYRTKRNGERTTKGVIKEINKMMDLAMKAHFQKRRFIEKIMFEPGFPMWPVGKKAKDGRPYIDLDKASYLIGMLGLNECVKAICGKELHESDEAYKIGLEIISAMYLKAKQLQKETGLKINLEETPAESASLRMAKVDLIEYPESKNYVRGNQKTKEVYYTNSVHYASDAPVDIIQRIEGQARFNPLIESGAITHCFVGEKLPDPKSIENLVKKTFYNTESAQIVISPEFTVCQDCHSVSPGYNR